MVIKSSSSRQIDTLMADLMSERQVVREGAVARLTVIGGRAVERRSSSTCSGKGHELSMTMSRTRLLVVITAIALPSLGVAAYGSYLQR
ncbi:MAG TPA: hypothetical protein VL371_14370, partial [Gemmataceae bacterium]|nr:hypothetical protein [Gemmataceae bacterium]